MDSVEEVRLYCLSLPKAHESFPFGDDTLVFKVGNKAFVLMGVESIPPAFNAKCDPERALELRERYPLSILPGFHMNKKHWNTVVLNGELSPHEIRTLIDDSYYLVIKGMTHKEQMELQRG